MHPRSLVAVLVATGLLAVAVSSSARAQGLGLKATPPPRDRVAPSLPERDLYPQRPALPQRPHFFGPLSRDTKNGHAGVAGYPVPNVPVGSRVAGDPANPGWAGVGFAIEWGRPEGAD